MPIAAMRETRGEMAKRPVVAAALCMDHTCRPSKDVMMDGRQRAMRRPPLLLGPGYPTIRHKDLCLSRARVESSAYKVREDERGRTGDQLLSQSATVVRTGNDRCAVRITGQECNLCLIAWL